MEFNQSTLSGLTFDQLSLVFWFESRLQKRDQKFFCGITGTLTLKADDLNFLYRSHFKIIVHRD